MLHASRSQLEHYKSGVRIHNLNCNPFFCVFIIIVHVHAMFFKCRPEAYHPCMTCITIPSSKHANSCSSGLAVLTYKSMLDVFLQTVTKEHVLNVCVLVVALDNPSDKWHVVFECTIFNCFRSRAKSVSVLKKGSDTKTYLCHASISPFGVILLKFGF